MARALYFLLALLAFVLIVTVALLSQKCSAPVFPAGFDPRRTLDEARAREEDSGKPVLVFVTADWCDDCKALRAGALNSSRISNWIHDQTESVYLDVTRSASGDSDMQALMAKLGVESPPAIVLLRKGKEIGRVDAVMSSKELLQKLTAIAKGSAGP
jgi:thiol:disulfide interchange protein